LPGLTFPLSVILSIALLVLCFLPNTARGQDSAQAYLQLLLDRAEAMSLHEERYWHLLLHYRSAFPGGIESEADEPGFFLAPNGKTDPEAELQSTLTQFFSSDLVGRSPQPARCAFMARYHWLKSALAIDESRLPQQPCERFQSWLAELNPASITVIFPSAFMNNPSSMFGHLLLRVDQKGQTERTSILAYTINYAADVTTDNGILFAVLGLTGGFKGYFSTHPYYIKAKEYGDFENRDIWEYRLNLTEDQMQRLLMHAWEMGNATFDYFYFKENCAYQILALLDVADPELQLAERFWFYTFPSDAIRMIADKPGLVNDVTFRASRSTRIRRGRETLSAEEKSWLSKMVANPKLSQSEAFIRLPAERQAAVLELVSDYLLYKAATEEDSASFEARNKSILLARSKLKVRPVPTKVMPVSGAPDQGHKTMRAGLGVGWREGEFFNEANFRLAFHDLLDPEYGYTPGAQIQALGVTLRHYSRSDHTRIEKFTLLDILSLSPVDALFASPSWKINAALDTIQHHNCNFCRTGNLNVGIGLTRESSWLNREVYFGFAEFATELGRVFHGNHRVGGGLTVGAMADITDRWKLAVSGSYLNFPLGDKSDEWRLAAQQRYTLKRNLALRFDFNQRVRTQELLFNLQAFF
jgi:hypothetical protein